MASSVRPSVFKACLVAVLASVVAACQLSGPTPVSPSGARAGEAVAKVSRALAGVANSQAAGMAALSGQVDFPGRYSLQANASYASNGATLTLVALADNSIVTTGQTDLSGKLYLPLAGFNPPANSLYLLEATHGLDNNAAGSQMARFRTLLKWKGSAWDSISGATIGINSQTTAVAIISSIDPNVQPGGTMGKVTGTAVNTSPPFTGYSPTQISALATSIVGYLTNDLDPVASTPAIVPAITTLQPPNPGAGGAMIVMGEGFSPVPSGNTVLFGTATASLFMASPTALGVYVPANALQAGTVSVKTSLGTSSSNPAYVITTGSGGSGGSGGSSGLEVSSVSPDSGAPGDSIMVRGNGFSTTKTDNVVAFNGIAATVTYADPQTLIVTAPAGNTTGALTVRVGTVTKGTFFLSNVPTITSFNPTTANQSNTITISGQNFGIQGEYSAVHFNGSTDAPGINTWFNTQVECAVPSPSLSKQISGPLKVLTGSGVLSASGGTFTALQSLSEDFTTTTRRNTGATTATWGSGAINPAAASAIAPAIPSNANTNTFSANGIVTLAPKNDGNLVFHTGVLPNITNENQIGVDGTYYYIPYGGSYSYQYSKTTGALQASKNTTYNTVVYDPNNYNGQKYISYNAYTSNSYPFYLGTTPWATTYAISYYVGAYGWGRYPWYARSNYGGYLATNGAVYFAYAYNAIRGYYNFYGGNYSTSRYYDYHSSHKFSAYSAAGLTSVNTYYYVPSSSTTISTLSTMTTGGGGSSVNLPFSISKPSNASYPGAMGPAVGSDGSNLYILGNSAAYNGGKSCLFKFSVSGSTVTFLGAYNTSGNSVSPVATRPAGAIWDTVNFTATKPTGTTLTVDILDGATNNVLLSNVSSGQSLNSLTAATLKLRANLSTTDGKVTPVLNSWNVTTRGATAVSIGYDTSTLFASYKAPTINSSGTNAIKYSDSADNVTFGSWVTSPTALSRRYIRYEVSLLTSASKVTGISMPYAY